MFAAPPASSPQVMAPGAVVDWNLARDGRRVVLAGPYRLTINAAKQQGAHAPMSAVVEVTAADSDPSLAISGRGESGVRTLLLAGAEGSDNMAYARIAVARLDPTSSAVSVVMSSFTGGAHCCDDIVIATPSNAASLDGGAPPGWSVLRPGAFDGAALGSAGTARLPSAGATSGLSIPDDRFDYVFGCYACSYAPLRVYGLRAGVLADRTLEPAFRPLLEADMRTAEVACRQGQAGVCPGYLADAGRLGLWASAWKVVTSSIQAQPQSGYPNQLCDGVRVEDKCHPGERAQTIPTYFAAVRLFLKWRGYPVPAGR